ncbi:MAG: leucine-rich repeat protein [Tannerellaceae bacterium]|jgi:hypothetical protein|nr:leucine-rich repeat protein [Tannerellaceae bacterium]
MKSTITFFTVCALFLGAATGWGQSDLGGGTIENTSLEWVLDADGVLTVSATGGPEAMPSMFARAECPWNNLRSEIKSVVIGEGVTSIGDYAFADCGELLTATVAESVTVIERGVFSYAEKLNSINLDKVETIKSSAFNSCRGLTAITLPATLTLLEESVFSQCVNLETVTVEAGNTVYTAHNGVLCNTVSKTLLLYPAKKTDDVFSVSNVERIANEAFEHNEYIERVHIAASVKSIGNGAFSECRALYQVTLNEGLESIGDQAFYMCSSIGAITLPSSLTTIGNYAFAYNLSLNSLNIPAGVTSIGEGIAAYCSRLQTITVDDSNTAYDSYMGVLYTRDWSKLVMYPVGKNMASFTVPEGVSVIGHSAFSCIDAYLTSVVCSESLTEIEYSAFYNATSLASIDLKNVTTLGAYAFAGSGLTSVTLPVGVTSIPPNLFANCSSLTSVTIPEGVTAIGEYSFYRCTSLAAINIPESVTSIDRQAFLNCSALSAVTIPAAVNSIGAAAFSACSSLKDVTVRWQTPVIPGEGSFTGIHADATLHVPPGTASAYSSADIWKDFTIEELETLTAEPEVTDAGGGIALSLTIPSNSTILGSFKALFPEGISLDESRTKLVEALSPPYIITVEEAPEANAWLLTIADGVTADPDEIITPSLRSATQITRILDIGFTLSDAAANGDYEIILSDFNLTLKNLDTDDESPITDLSELKVTISVTRSVAVSNIAITPGSLSGEVGGSAQLSVEVTPASAADKTVTWTSSDNSVATVDANGLVTYAGVGTATVTATANDGSGKSASIPVTVTEPYIPVDPDPIVTPVTAIAIAPGSLTGAAGSTAQLSATITPDNATDATVTWTSSLNAVATVSSSGLVTCVAIGTASITATANDGSGVSASIIVTVTPQMGAEAADNVALVVLPLNGGLQITGLTSGEELSIYDVSGQLLYKGKAAGGELYVSLSARGSVIVAAGKRVVKAVVK